MSPIASTQIRIARPTNNIEALLPFYVDGLGMSILFRFDAHEGFDGAMVGWEPASVEAAQPTDPLDPADRARRAPLPAPAYHLEFTMKKGHDAGRAPSQDNLLVFYLPNEQEHNAATERMAAAGFPPVAAFNPYWDRYGKTNEDPDGYRIVLAKQQSPF
ncbi:hypothetical protein SCUCBS95973_003066 [Sporothrix curviconia]|uniref:VOC domain-containing protein n=1 Tax=Sporothrix curviconia TaxID=1260050 RepID=A0ABP0BCB3_9PEZI